MEYFDIISRIIAIAFAFFGILLFLFVIIRDNFYKNDKSNGNKGDHGDESHYDLW